MLKTSGEFTASAKRKATQMGGSLSQNGKNLAGDFLQQLLINIEIGVDVLHVVMFF